jgi:uncharacterized protein YlaI
MIVDEFIEIKVPHKTVKYYRDIGYDCNVNDIILIRPEHLPKCSEVRINVKCSNCGSINNISNNNYINKQLKKYEIYVCKNCSHIHRKKTMMERYGVEYYSKHEDFKGKVEKTSMYRYNFSNYTKTTEYKEKSRITSNIKYGEDYYMKNSDNYKKLQETLISKYGVDNPSQVNGVNIGKRILTNLSKYGVEHAIQNDIIFNKKFNRKKIDDLYYDSSYELKFINLCREKEIHIERMKGIKYILENKERVYYPDFYLPKYNLIIEIKSQYTYNYDINQNISKKEGCINKGYNFLFIIDNIFDEFLEKIKNI